MHAELNRQVLMSLKHNMLRVMTMMCTSPQVKNLQACVFCYMDSTGQA
jgi:hypothetical protein